MTFKTKKLILSIATVLSVLAVIIFRRFFFETHTGMTALIALMLALAALSLLWWRCPHCKKGLGRLFFGVDYCPKCGKELD